MYQGVTAFVGMPGSGKTYALAQIAHRELRAERPVWCNAGFDVAGAAVFSSFEEFCAIPNGATVVWDELPLYVNARKWSEFPDGLLYRLTQIRKDGLRLYYSAIDEAMVDATVRRVTFWFWHCRAITARLLTRSLWPPESFRRAKQRPYRRELVIVRQEVAALYDTLGKVAVAEPVAPRRRDSFARRWVRPVVGGIVAADGPQVDVIEAAEGVVKEGNPPRSGGAEALTVPGLLDAATRSTEHQPAEALVVETQA
jgi:hypothetical protein